MRHGTAFACENSTSCKLRIPLKIKRNKVNCQNHLCLYQI